MATSKHKNTLDEECATDSEQIKNIGQYVLAGAYINCSTANCANHDIEEAFPDDAAKLFFEKGWRYINKMVYCPDCVIKNKKGK